MDETEKELNPDELEDEDAIVDPDLILGDEDAVLDEEEVNPFGDKWEE